MTVELKSKPNKVEKRVPLFTIDGTEYTVPAKPRPNIGLKYLWDLKIKGEEIAKADLLAAMLGEDGFAALSNFEDLTADDLEAVMKAVEDIALGEPEKGTPGAKTRGNA
jgi:hypothetical protein